MVPFLVDGIEEIVTGFCTKFILSTVDFIKLDVMDRNFQKPDVDLGFGMKHEISLLKSTQKITENFKMCTKRFFVKDESPHLEAFPNSIPFYMLVQVYGPNLHGGLPWRLQENMEKQVSSKYITCTLADDAKSEYRQFLNTIVKKIKKHLRIVILINII